MSKVQGQKRTTGRAWAARGQTWEVFLSGGKGQRRQGGVLPVVRGQRGSAPWAARGGLGGGRGGGIGLVAAGLLAGQLCLLEGGQPV
jgi:hypothetical protein